MKKVISFSLWGSNPKYTIGAIKNADKALEIYPDWICRYYLGRTVPIQVVEELIKRKNTEIFIMNEEGNWTGMFWRFLAADDPNVDVMISRDTDSRVSLREKAAVEDWLNSDKDFHIIRDHPYHLIEILGGMWGARNHVLTGISKAINQYQKGDFWQVDQNFLKQIVYPKIKNLAKVHDDFFEKKPLPHKRENFEFIGQVFDENDNPDLSHVEILRKNI
jgi:protein O-GlcNAc transferase